MDLPALMTTPVANLKVEVMAAAPTHKLLAVPIINTVVQTVILATYSTNSAFNNLEFDVTTSRCAKSKQTNLFKRCKPCGLQ